MKLMTQMFRAFPDNVAEGSPEYCQYARYLPISHKETVLFAKVIPAWTFVTIEVISFKSVSRQLFSELRRLVWLTWHLKLHASHASCFVTPAQQR